MKRRAIRPLLLALLLVAAIGGDAWAWEAECHIYGRKCDYQCDDELALGTWDGEHRTICRHVLQSAAFPAELLEAALPLPVPSDASGFPVAWTDAVALQERGRPLCEFAELADFSYGLEDWAGVHSRECPVPTHPSLACHHELTMGAYNSTHFGAQAAAMYRHYHQLAVGVAAACAATHGRVVAAEEEWRAMEEREGQSVPFEIRDEDELKACEATAYVIEAVGQHYLTDSWSSGHMWQRWGAPVPVQGGGHTLSLLVSLAAGLIHGVARPPFENDFLIAPHPDVRWVLPGQIETPQPGAGDTYLARVLDDNGGFAEQRERLLSCSVDGFADVFNAGPKMWNEADGAAMAGLEGRAFDDARCLGPLVTNTALAAGLTAEMRYPWGHSSISWRTLVDDSERLAAVVRALVSEVPGLADELDPWFRGFAESYTRVSMDIEIQAQGAAMGYGAAAGDLPDFLGVAPNDAYLGTIPPPYAEPAGDWPLEESESGEGGRVRDLRRVFSAGFLDTWCLKYGEAELLALRERCSAGGGDVCVICERALLRKLNFMADGPDLPICNFVGLPEQEAMFGGPYPCHRDAASCPYIDFPTCVVASDADIVYSPTPEVYAVNWCAGLTRLDGGPKITPEDCQPPPE